MTHLHRMLHPGGLILIEVPDIQALSARLMRARCRHYVPDHLNFFCSATLERFLREHGFDVLRNDHPSRCISVRHLVGYWGEKYLGSRAARALQRAAAKAGLWEKTLRLNIGDILVAIGRKVDQPG
jgi:hypothetical protein